MIALVNNCSLISIQNAGKCFSKSLKLLSAHTNTNTNTNDEHISWLEWLCNQNGTKQVAVITR